MSLRWLAVCAFLLLIAGLGALLVVLLRKTEDNESWGDGPRTPSPPPAPPW